MTRTLRALVVLSVLAAGSTALAGTAQAATAFNGQRCTIVGTAGPDIIHGTAGNDVICGLGGDDHLYGMGGNDVLDGGYGWDWLWGGSGTDILSGGPDVDTVWYDDHPQGVRVVMDAKPDSGTGAEHDTIGSTVENVVGSNHNDTIIGNKLTRNVLYGKDGDDLLESPESSDNRSGYGDEIYGGRGVDEVTYAWVTDPRVSVGVRVDNRLGDGGDRYVKDNVYDDVEIVRGGVGNDRLYGNQYSNELIGGPGDDLLQGLGGPDYLYGEVGHDTASYAEKTTSVSVTMNHVDDDGTAGEKDYVDPSIEAVTLGAGNDTFHGSTLPMTVAGGAGDDTLVGGSAGDVFRGGSGNDHLMGNGGDDNLSGEDGNDVVDGGDGRDLLFGANGDDQLLGGAGNDRLHGGPGTDSMDGGDGVNVCDSVSGETTAGCSVVGSVGDTTPVLTGHVLDSSSAPISGATVSGSTTTTTDAAGAYAVAAGSSLVVTLPSTATKPSMRFASPQTFTSDTDGLDLTLPDTQTASVHVTDQHGAPIAGAFVDLSGATYLAGSAGAQAVPEPDQVLNPGLSPFATTITLGAADRSTDATGLVAFPVLGSVIPHLRVIRNDPHAGIVGTDLETDVPFGDTPLERSLTLVSAHLVLTLQDRLGNPLSGITFSDANASGTYTATSGADGTVVMDVPKAQSTWTLGTSGASLVGYVDLTSGDRSATLTLPNGNRTVHVQGSDGQPLAGATVWEYEGNQTVSVSPDLPVFSTNKYYCSYGCTHTTTTDSSGDVAVPALGFSQVTVTAPGPVPGSSRAWSQAWAATTEPETLALDTRDSVISGSITDGAGHAFSGVKLVGQVYSTPTTTGAYDDDVSAADGTFALHSTPTTTSVQVSGTLAPGLPRTFTLASTDVAAPAALAIVLHPVPLTVHVQDVSGKPVGSGFILTVNGSTTVPFTDGGATVNGSYGDDLHGTDLTGTVRDVVFPGTASLIRMYGNGHYGQLSDVTIGASGAELTLKLSS